MRAPYELLKWQEMVHLQYFLKLTTIGCTYLYSIYEDFFPIYSRTLGPRPGPPRNISVTEVESGFLVTWAPPAERLELLKFYTIEFRTDKDWKDLTRNAKIRPDETKYIGMYDENVVNVLRSCQDCGFLGRRLLS